EMAAETAALLDQAYGPYWGRRAGQLLTVALPANVRSASAELLARAADSLYVQCDFDRALATYDEAAAAARAGSDGHAWLASAYKAALIEQQRGRNTAAADRLRILAKSHAKHQQAPSAHLLAAWNMAQASRDNSTAAASYEELLREHLLQWPTAASADQARI